MSLLVVKFGGTSVGNTAKIINAAEIVKSLKDKGHSVVVVVSAMAGETNKILSLASEISSFDSDKKRSELDAALSTGETLSASLFAMRLIDMGIDSISLNAWQVRIKTNDSPNSSLIKEIDSDCLASLIKDGITPVIAGFQGVNKNGRITTLGRGGSDTTAAAIAASLNADYCDIYTDVEGIFTCDPRLNLNVKLIKEISFEETLELAGAGAKVLHPRSVEICMRYGVPIRVYSTEKNYSGTIIMNQVDEINKVTAVGYIKNQILIRLKASNEMSVNDIIKNISHVGMNIEQILGFCENEISFLVKLEEKPKLMSLLSNFEEYQMSEHISSVSIIGASVRHDKNILYKGISALEKNDINIISINNSEIRLSFYVSDDDAEKTVKLLHREFIENE